VLTFVQFAFHTFENDFKTQLQRIEDDRPELPAKVEEAFQNLPVVRNARENIDRYYDRFYTAARCVESLLPNLVLLRDDPRQGEIKLHASWGGSLSTLASEIRFCV
jgi:hypothetical protein